MGKKYTENEIKFIKNYLIENYTKIQNKEICKFLGICDNTLRKFTSELNLKPLFRNKIPDLCERICPECGDKIIYKNKSARFIAEKNKYSCKHCSMLGDKNPFFNKTHTEATKNYFRETHKGKSYSSKTEFKKGHQSTHDLNFYNNWKEKYDEETYIKKVNEHKKKIAYKSAGENNPMYGKPSPMGSGNGWSGWYKEWFFRSINELSYMINVIERFNLSWESGEKNKWKITYIDWKGQERNYFPDFIIAGKYIVECKPKKLWNTPSVINKTIGAKIFANEKNMIYKIKECKKLSLDELKFLYKNKIIKFTEKYEIKFIRLCQK